MTISQFEDFIKENDCADMVNINISKLLRSPIEHWFWFSLKQNSSKAVAIELKWQKFIKQNKKGK